MAMCVIAVVEVAPCQCFSPGGHQTTSPGRISCFGPPSLCTHPHPDVTIRVCPSGCVCHAVRAPGSNVTLTPRTRAGSGAWNSGSMRTKRFRCHRFPAAFIRRASRGKKERPFLNPIITPAVANECARLLCYADNLANNKSDKTPKPNSNLIRAS